ncbi:hypothetical protein [Halobacterium rubrum]|uniref:hypothetical protein n=1 Tax=Halobacterium TaxID=2239 RepID=UPI001F167604|nr:MULTISPECIES: hypothetical protein [Halobacterium]MDH5020376.1 hypothetical protein [Halobacterium rubrum]
MSITEEEYERLEPTIRRGSRTEGSERYSVYSEVAKEEQIFNTTSNLIGRLIVEYHSEEYIHATVILSGDWKPEAVESLIQEFEYQHIPDIGPDSKPRHGQFGITVHDNSSWLPFDLHNLDRLTPEPDRVDEVRKQLGETQEMVDSLPEELEKSVDDLIADHYSEIEDIIESERGTEEKKQELQKRLQIGLERGLPTAIYERSSGQQSGD